MDLLDQLIPLLRTMGLPGLFLLAFVDSAGIPTSGGPDLLILVLASGGSDLLRLILVAAIATLASTLGCLVFYALGRRAGRPALDRFSPERREQIRRQIDRYGFWAILLAVFAPPPYPMKLFVLSAGVFRMPVPTFTLAVLLGRGVRYLGVGYLAVRYGERAGALLRDQFPLTVGLLLAGSLLLLLLRRWRERRRSASAALLDGESRPLA